MVGEHPMRSFPNYDEFLQYLATGKKRDKSPLPSMSLKESFRDANEEYSDMKPEGKVHKPDEEKLDQAPGLVCELFLEPQWI